MAYTNVVDILTSNWGWLFTIAVFLYQLMWPLWETKLQTLVNDLRDDIQDDIKPVEEKLDTVDGKVDEMDEKQVATTQVIRALATTDEEIDTDAVDSYLHENGVSKDYFFANGRNTRFHGDDD